MREQDIVCREVAFGSAEYERTVALRNRILRQPLGLTFGPSDAAADRTSVHLSCWQHDDLLACAVMTPLEGGRIRLRQFAVNADRQGRGIGTRLARYAEAYAHAAGYTDIELHARETAAAFYEKLGYRREGERFIEVTLPHVLMRKRLGAGRDSPR